MYNIIQIQYTMHNMQLEIPHLKLHRPLYTKLKQGKGFSYSLPSVGPRANPGVQAVNPQVTISHPPSGRLPLLSAMDDLVTCGLTACTLGLTPGQTLGNEYGKPLPFFNN